jgi:hypothetical protein
MSAVLEFGDMEPFDQVWKRSGIGQEPERKRTPAAGKDRRGKNKIKTNKRKGIVMSVISDVLARQSSLTRPARIPPGVEEVMETLSRRRTSSEFVKANIYERIIEPERTMLFRVPWVDDKGNVR